MLAVEWHFAAEEAHFLTPDGHKAKYGSIKQAVSLMNAIDPGLFPRLLSRILQKLHLKAERSFSEEEEEKLQAAFSLEKRDLQLLLETIAFILEQAVYQNVKPLALQQQLENIHLNADKAEAFASVWAAAGQETVEKFRQRSLAPKKLETTSWQLNLQMAQSTQAKMKSPRAVLELGISNEDSKVESNTYICAAEESLICKRNKSKAEDSGFAKEGNQIKCLWNSTMRSC
ncbi:COMM domain-containing protein 10 isoform X3 [Rhinatrema bivittatum]|uniref:COMM domain-containing protein 10 isoform X3 n=1 Tax=Rhinatrema bivittatum TaxID=194408 RepID=UPI0011265738|nr:COMM domain-containing protein 10 isoform X3 [Rhinatrema bivittatum]